MHPLLCAFPACVNCSTPEPPHAAQNKKKKTKRASLLQPARTAVIRLSVFTVWGSCVRLIPIIDAPWHFTDDGQPIRPEPIMVNKPPRRPLSCISLTGKLGWLEEKVMVGEFGIFPTAIAQVYTNHATVMVFSTFHAFLIKQH